MHSDLNHANHKWSICGDYISPPPILLCLCRHEPNIWIQPDLSQVYFCPLYQIFIFVFWATIPATTASSDSSVRLLNCPRAGTTCCTASSCICSICSFIPAPFTGSNSGYQADPSQLPEDVVHPGRDRCVPHRLHTVVCGNNEHCCSSSSRLPAAAVLLTVCD